MMNNWFRNIENETQVQNKIKFNKVIEDLVTNYKEPKYRYSIEKNKIENKYETVLNELLDTRYTIEKNGFKPHFFYISNLYLSPRPICSWSWTPQKMFNIAASYFILYTILDTLF